jgi:hypothetical protein
MGPRVDCRHQRRAQTGPARALAKTKRPRVPAWIKSEPCVDRSTQERTAVAVARGEGAVVAKAIHDGTIVMTAP